MKKSILNLGKTLNKEEKQAIKGAWWPIDAENEMSCNRLGGIWYDCVHQCVENRPHFPPCA